MDFLITLWSNEWAITNAMAFGGLLFATIPGLKSGNQTICEQAYGETRIPKFVENNGKKVLSEDEKTWLKGKIVEIVREKIYYTIGFVFSAIAVLLDCFIDTVPPVQECEKILSFILWTIIWFIIANVFKKLFEKWKISSVIKDIESERINLAKGMILVTKEKE